jgi:hypothetical protein
MTVSDYTYLRWFYQQIVTYSLSARQFFPLLLRRNRIGLRLEREIREARILQLLAPTSPQSVSSAAGVAAPPSGLVRGGATDDDRDGAAAAVARK